MQVDLEDPLLVPVLPEVSLYTSLYLSMPSVPCMINFFLIICRSQAGIVPF